MRIALTGASGFIGSAAARTIASAGHEVVALVRPTSETEHLCSTVTRFVTGDQRDPSIWRELVGEADAVIHNAVDWEALRSGELLRHLDENLVGAVGLLEAAREAGVSRFVFVSSVATHHDIRPGWGGVIDEDHPLRPASLYGATKAAVEPFLWHAHFAHGMHTAAIRPAGVYGVEPVKLERSLGYRVVKDVLEGKRVTPENHPGGGKFVHVDDVALAMLRAVEQDDAAGRAFNLADGYAKWTRFAQHAAELTGADASLVEPNEDPPARNQFSKTAAQETLGVGLDRGDAGLGDYVRELIEAIRAREA